MELVWRTIRALCGFAAPHVLGVLLSGSRSKLLGTPVRTVFLLCSSLAVYLSKQRLGALTHVYTMQVGSRESSAGDERADVSFKLRIV
jgi:hypothetical protein